MALRALLFSKSPEPAELLAQVFKELGIRAEVCSDIFNAIEKGTKQNFSCVIVNWSDQPEANFLLKRARESAANGNAVMIAIVDKELTPEELRESRLEFLLYRPLAVDEARAVLMKACRQMQIQAAALDADEGGSVQQFETAEASRGPEDPDLVSIAAEAPKRRAAAPETDSQHRQPEESTEFPEESAEFDEAAIDEAKPERSRPVIQFRTVCAAVLACAAVFSLWRSRETVLYLSQTHEGIFQVLKESMAALLYTNRTGAQPVDSVIADAHQDAYFARTAEKGHGDPLGLVSTEASVPEGAVRLPKAFDFPLPTPELLHTDPPPLHVQHGPVPESLRGTAPIGPPVIATVGPAQIMPVSTPTPPIPQFSEPVHLSEDAARAILVHSVDPVYPPQAAAQKLQGPVVLQATIGRDGSVEDLKIVRGYFVLGRAAIAAVKQWRFQPYILNGRPAETQTVLTINFNRP
ncbi:MAG: TonB family protein [Acidobacteriia bacterium]|nr:TonB family protein [Terriglobia bacterium]